MSKSVESPLAQPGAMNGNIPSPAVGTDPLYLASSGPASGQSGVDPASRVNAVLAVFGTVISLAMAALVCVMIAAYQETVRVADQHERRQVENAFARKLRSMRTDLTSVTFWDEAVRKTAIEHDRQWTDENIGRWLAQFYGVDESYVLDSSGAPWLAFRDGRAAPLQSFAPIAPIAGPMVSKVRARARDYRPEASSSAVRDSFDSARLALVNGQPAYVIVSPILPDFGKAPGYSGSPMLLVTVQRIDAAVLAEISSGLMIEPLHFQRLDEPYRRGEGHFVLPLSSPGAAAVELRWHRHALGRDLVGGSMPLLVLLVAFLVSISLFGLHRLRQVAETLLVSRFEANHDELTKLANRRMLTRQLADRLAAGKAVTLMFVDLDRFKQVNDLWGHAEGDRVIKEAAQRLRRTVPDGIVARFGGDEFVVLIEGGPEVSEDTGRALLAALRTPYTVAGKMMTLAGSIGIAFAPAHSRQPGELMRKADLALYRAKASGKNQMILFDAEMEAALQERQAIELDLRNAIREGHFTIVYQPQVCRLTGRIVAVEALARWARPGGREVEPKCFIAIAEEAGIVAEIDALILRHACREATHWGELILTVNVSPQELRTPYYARLVRDVLAETGLPPQRLRLEITESALLEDSRMVSYTVRELNQLGVSFTLDNFGTGYSSLDHLRTLNLAGMKIARNFVADLGRDPSSIALVTSIIALGHSLGLSVTAEGVETKEQLALLKAAGCDELQGYLFGHPVGAEVLRKRLRLPRAA